MPVGLPGGYCEPIGLSFLSSLLWDIFTVIDICCVVVSLYKCGLFLWSALYKFNALQVILFLKSTLGDDDVTFFYSTICSNNLRLGMLGLEVKNLPSIKEIPDLYITENVVHVLN
jgi:hypothetical protein